MVDLWVEWPKEVKIKNDKSMGRLFGLLFGELNECRTLENFQIDKVKILLINGAVVVVSQSAAVEMRRKKVSAGR